MVYLIVWGTLMVVSLLVELSSPGFLYFLALSSGAACALGVAALDGSFRVQAIVCAAMTVLQMVVIRRYVRSVAAQGEQTNVYAVLGKQGVVLDELAPLKRGWVKIDGQIWAAVPIDNTPIGQGAVVTVMHCEGSHVQVKEVSPL